MPTDRRVIEVWADWASLESAVRMGTLTATPARGREIFSFEYDVEWLSTGPAPALDPALQLFRGPQYLAEGRDNFGVFLDSSPDRWGRLLMRRREALRASREGRSERKLSELDYLLGVFDGHRLGGLRFRVDGGPFLDSDAELASPPWTSLRELEAVAVAVDREDAEANPEHAKWLMMLIAPGRSLGGARPKASVVDSDGALWLAKFPSERDEHDVGAWEGIVHRLARRAGVATADSRLERFAGRYHTFLTRRFDRTADGQRVHFASAMTMLQRKDGEEGASYLELAEVLARRGAHAARDLEQLWRRIVFFVCVSNADDHLRNHGFLLEPRGWSLAPAYDMNPVADADGLVLNISETDNRQDLELVRGVARHFRIKAPRAEGIISEVVAAVMTWRSEAKSAGITRPNVERMAQAFRVAEAESAATPTAT